MERYKNKENILYSLLKAVNQETGEIKFFDSPGALRIFLKKNPKWVYRG